MAKNLGQKTNVLITGGAGFIGSNLASKLHQKGYNVTVLDNLSKQIHGDEPAQTSPLFQSLPAAVRFIKGDVVNKSDLEIAIENQDIIVHLAAETGTGQSMYQIAQYSNVNIGGTSLLLDLLANGNHSVQKLVVASSRSIYGEGKYHSEEFGVVYPNHRESSVMDNGDYEVKYDGCSKPLTLLPTDELSKIHPSSVYGITKQVQEQLVMSVCNAIGIQGVAFRYQNVYGPGQSLSNPYTGILSIFSTRIHNGNPINVFEDGEESRDFVFIDDVVDATILGIEKEEANGQVFNVGTGVPVSVNTVVKELMKNYGKQVEVTVSGNYRIGDIRHNYADISKIKTLLNYSPKVNFAEGVSKFCEWVKGQEIKKDLYNISIEELKAKGLYK